MEGGRWREGDGELDGENGFGECGSVTEMNQRTYSYKGVNTLTHTHTHAPAHASVTLHSLKQNHSELHLCVSVGDMMPSITDSTSVDLAASPAGSAAQQTLE